MIGEATIIRRDGCVLVKGALSPDVLMALAKEAPKGSVMCADVARLAGAGLAMGLPDDLARLRAALAAEAPRRRHDGLGREAAEWLAVGHQGLSSAALFLRATGVRPDILRDGDDARHHPRDPADLNRCLLLVATVPEAARALPGMREVSPEWAALVDHWDELAALFHEEAGPDWSKARSAPRTYARMAELLGR